MHTLVFFERLNLHGYELFKGVYLSSTKSQCILGASDNDKKKPKTNHTWAIKLFFILAGEKDLKKFFGFSYIALWKKGLPGPAEHLLELNVYLLHEEKITHTHIHTRAHTYTEWGRQFTLILAAWHAYMDIRSKHRGRRSGSTTAALHTMDSQLALSPVLLASIQRFFLSIQWQALSWLNGIIDTHRSKV